MPARSLLMLALFLAVPPSVNTETDPLLQLLQHKYNPKVFPGWKRVV